MTRPDSLFEAASYDLNQFIERRLAERRLMPRDSSDRRKQPEARRKAAEPFVAPHGPIRRND